MLYKENWEESKVRFKALWENELIDRCCVAVKAPRKGVRGRMVRNERPDSHEDLARNYTDPGLVLERWISEFKGTYYGGEALPVLNPTWGDSGFALYFRCNYKYSGNTTWFSPTIDDWTKDVSVLNSNTVFIEKHKRFIQFMAKHAKDKFLLSLPDYIGNADGLINLRGVQKTLIDMKDDPERFLEGICAIRQQVKTTGGSFFNIINKACQGGSAFAWYNTWAEGRHNLVQCDFSAMISPEMFEKLVLPDLEEICNWLDCAVYHLDGQEQLRHLDMILSLKNLKMIQWTNVAGRPSVISFIPVFKKIQKAGKGLLLFADMKEAEVLLEELSPKGLLINLPDASSEEEADEFIRKIAMLSLLN